MQVRNWDLYLLYSNLGVKRLVGAKCETYSVSKLQTADLQRRNILSMSSWKEGKYLQRYPSELGNSVAVHVSMKYHGEFQLGHAY